MHRPDGGRVQCWGYYIMTGSVIATGLLHFHNSETPSTRLQPNAVGRRSTEDTGTLCSSKACWNLQQDDTKHKLTMLAWLGSVVSLL